MARLKAKGKPAVNLSAGKTSFLVLEDKISKRFSINTVVLNPVEDDLNKEITFHGVTRWIKAKGKKDRLAVLLTGNVEQSPFQLVEQPDAGALVVTLSDNGEDVPVADIDVVYVHDDETA